MSESNEVKNELSSKLSKKQVQAKDCICCECDNPAVAFWPIIDIDIPHYPYCRSCLDNAEHSLMIKMLELDLL